MIKYTSPTIEYQIHVIYIKNKQRDLIKSVYNFILKTMFVTRTPSVNKALMKIYT
jgi:hypothetical protein